MTLAEAVKARAADRMWLDEALRRVTSDPDAIAVLFPAVGRRCGRGPLVASGRDFGASPERELAGWTVDDAARVLLLGALPLRGEALAAQVGSLYRYGDAAEKRAVLRALPDLELLDGGVDLVLDAVRTNDPRLVAAAVGPCAACLDAQMWRQAVLKCVFMEIPLGEVADLDRRADRELGRMLAALDEERRAAGRSMPADAGALLTLIGREATEAA